MLEIPRRMLKLSSLYLSNCSLHAYLGIIAHTCILALRRLSGEDHEFQASLNCIVISCLQRSKSTKSENKPRDTKAGMSLTLERVKE